jgi:NAD(P)-dependent dehydrogenase (short-subunit alcohol dehydrogenase family)
VTGATSGIGRALAEALAAAGVTVGVVARDRARGEAVREAIVSRTGNERIELYHGDLASLASVRGLAGSLTAAHPTLDALVHCAAAYVPRRMMTVDGFETMFATNHLAPFLLTSLLWPSLASSDAARVLVLTAPSTVQPDFDDLQGERRFRSLAAFGSTKAAELLFTFGLARRIAGGRITANAVHPGLARTNLMREAPLPIRWLPRLFSRSPERVAEDVAPLVLSPDYEGRSGRFFHRGREIDPPSFVSDVGLQDRLWAVSERLAGAPWSPTAPQADAENG